MTNTCPWNPWKLPTEHLRLSSREASAAEPRLKEERSHGALAVSPSVFAADGCFWD